MPIKNGKGSWEKEVERENEIKGENATTENPDNPATVLRLRENFVHERNHFAVWSIIVLLILDNYEWKTIFIWSGLLPRSVLPEGVLP